MDSVDSKFYADNAEQTFELQPLPFGTVQEQAKWIMQQTHIGWLELNLTHPIEVQDIEYYGHRGHETHTGWSSCCLHGLGVDKIATAPTYDHDEFTAPYEFTEIAEKFPSTVEFWKKFPAERFTRIRFMKIEAGGSISVHNDGYDDIPDDFDMLDGIIPINVAIVHPEQCDMVIEDSGIVPFAPSKVFLINVAKNHMVVNRSTHNRIHLIANIILGNKKDEFCKLLVESYEQHYRV